jgi:type VII secretion protein EccB
VQSRRDQLQAYKFLTRRALAALVAGEPDVPEAPMRRISLTTATGVMVAVLVVAGFAVFGLIRPGNNTKIESGTVYIERETGTSFVLLSDGDLHPALNFTSAALAVGQKGKVSVKTVSSGALAHKPHGAAVGIAGAPQSVPRSTSHIVSTPWTVCSQAHTQGASGDRAVVTVSIGSEAGSTRLPADYGVVASTPSNRSLPYLLWHGQRLSIKSQDVATALGLQAGNPLIVGSSLLNALPQGPPLATPTVADAGQAGPSVGGTPTLVGQLVQATDDGTFRAALRDGLTDKLTPVEVDLLRTLQIGGQPRDPVRTNLTNVLRAPVSSNPDDLLRQFKGLPSVVPTIPDAPTQAGGVCAIYTSNGSTALSVPQGTAPADSGTVSESEQSARGVADKVDVPASKAAIAVANNGAAARYLIVAPGKKYPASDKAMESLGYSSVTPAAVPAQLLLLIPTGPALDPGAATQIAAGS